MRIDPIFAVSLIPVLVATAQNFAGASQESSPIPLSLNESMQNSVAPIQGSANRVLGWSSNYDPGIMNVPLARLRKQDDVLTKFSLPERLSVLSIEKIHAENNVATKLAAKNNDWLHPNISDETGSASPVLILEIESASGIGGVKLLKHPLGWPAKILLRLDTVGLEHFAIKTAGQIVVTVSADSHGAASSQLDETKNQLQIAKENGLEKASDTIVRLNWGAIKPSINEGILISRKNGPYGKLNEDLLLARSKASDGGYVDKLLQSDLKPVAAFWEIAIDPTIWQDANVVEMEWIDYYR